MLQLSATETYAQLFREGKPPFRQLDGNGSQSEEQMVLPHHHPRPLRCSQATPQEQRRRKGRSGQGEFRQLRPDKLEQQKYMSMVDQEDNFVIFTRASTQVLHSQTEHHMLLT
jgi:hypothetical protein